MWMLAAFIALFSVFFYQYTIPLTNAAKNKKMAPERNIIVVGGGLAGMSAAIEVKHFSMAMLWCSELTNNLFRPNYTVLR